MTHELFAAIHRQLLDLLNRLEREGHDRADIVAAVRLAANLLRVEADENEDEGAES